MEQGGEGFGRTHRVTRGTDTLGVVTWLDVQPAESIWISSITLFEASYGLALLPAGRRQALLQERLDQLLQDDLEISC